MKELYVHVMIHGQGSNDQLNMLRGKILAYEEMCHIAEYIKQYKKTN